MVSPSSLVSLFRILSTNVCWAWRRPGSGKALVLVLRELTACWRSQATPGLTIRQRQKSQPPGYGQGTLAVQILSSSKGGKTGRLGRGSTRERSIWHVATKALTGWFLQIPCGGGRDTVGGGAEFVRHQRNTRSPPTHTSTGYSVRRNPPGYQTGPHFTQNFILCQQAAGGASGALGPPRDASGCPWLQRRYREDDGGTLVV